MNIWETFPDDTLNWKAKSSTIKSSHNFIKNTNISCYKASFCFETDFTWWISSGSISLSDDNHCVKSVQIRSYFWPVFSCIRIEYGVNLRIQSEYRKIRTRNNSVFTQFSRSVSHFNILRLIYSRVSKNFRTNFKLDLNRFYLCTVYPSLTSKSSPITQQKQYYFKFEI